MFRKITIIMATVFLATLSPDLQVLVALLIVVVNQFVQNRVRPYSSNDLNTMEQYSLIVASLTLYFGMFYVSGRHYTYMQNSLVNWLFLGFLVIPNFLLFGFWLHKIRLELLKEIYKLNIPWLFMIASCTSMKAFGEKYSV